jgi:hypothetical protein
LRSTAPLHFGDPTERTEQKADVGQRNAKLQKEVERRRIAADLRENGVVDDGDVVVDDKLDRRIERFAVFAVVGRGAAVEVESMLDIFREEQTEL